MGFRSVDAPRKPPQSGGMANTGDPELDMFLTFGIAPKPKPKPKAPGGFRVIDPPKPAAPRRGQARPLIDEANGLMANFYSNIPFADELNAGVMALGDIAQGKYKPRSGFGDPLGLTNAALGLKDTYASALARQRGSEDDFRARRPVAAGLAQAAGTTASVFVPGGVVAQTATAPTRVQAAATGALTAAGQGYLYGVSGRGTIPERLESGNRSALISGVLGGVLGAATTRSPAKPPKPVSAVNELRARGVQPTIGQSQGGMVKQVEDLAQRVPVLGPAISGARARVYDQFNRGVGLEAVSKVGGNIPKKIAPGFQTVQHVEKVIGKVYDDAIALVPRVTADDQLAADLAGVAARKVDLPEGQAAQFDRIIADRLARLSRGEVSGETVKVIQSELRGLSREFAGRGEETMAAMLDDSAGAVMGLVARTNPQAGQMIKQADEGWRIYSMMNDAAAAATNRGGVFTPGQFNMQVRKDARGIGSNMAGKGQGTLQDYATAATQILPDQFGNPGTANALALMGTGYGIATNPLATTAAVGGTLAAATPYFLAARKTIERLPPNAGRAELAAAERELADLAARDPAVAALLQQVQARLAKLVGAGAASTQSRPNALAISPQ